MISMTTVSQRWRAWIGYFLRRPKRASDPDRPQAQRIADDSDRRQNHRGRGDHRRQQGAEEREQQACRNRDRHGGRQLSPVNITTGTPSRRRAASAAGVGALTGSAMASVPASFPSTPAGMAVAPSPRRSSAASDSPAGLDAVLVKKGAVAEHHPTVGHGAERTLPVGERMPQPGNRASPLTSAACTIAIASGWSLARSPQHPWSRWRRTTPLSFGREARL